MRAIVFDTETTGFKPGNICQLAYLMADDGRVSGKNLYFQVDYVEPGAQNVHGLSVEKLNELSGGKGFGNFAEEIMDDFASAQIWIAHNYSFDASFMSAEFRRCKMAFAAPKHFCTMQKYTPVMKLPSRRSWSGPGQYKYPTLRELIAFMGITDAEIANLADTSFKTEGSGISYHDARFDCAATYLCYQKGAASGFIDNSI